MTISRSARACGTAAALVALTIGVPAHAGPVQRIESVVVDISCVATTTQGGSVFLYGGVSDEGSGAGAFVEVPGAPGLEGQSGSLVVGDTISASVEMYSISDQSPVGTLSLAARVAGVGDPQREVIDDSVGNTWTRGSFTIETLVVEGVAIEVPGMAVVEGSGSCEASRYTFSVRSNDPAAVVLSGGDLDSQICPLAGYEDALVRISGGRADPYVEVVVADGPAKAAGPLQRRAGAWVASLDLVDLWTGEPLTTLEVGLTLRRQAGTAPERISSEGVTVQQWITPYVAEITASSADGQRGTASCSAYETRWQARFAPGISD